MNAILDDLGLNLQRSAAWIGTNPIEHPGGGEILAINPTTGQAIQSVRIAAPADYEAILLHAGKAFREWRMVPAPRRGELVRRIGMLLRDHKDALGRLITLEAGKIRSEGAGEVQEMIDMADFAVGLSRQLYGLTIASERPEHRMFEQWHPLGPVGIITAFNFPVAVWAWNAMLAAVCGDVCIWKPSPLTPLCAIAVQQIVAQAEREFGSPGIFSLCLGPTETIGKQLVEDGRIPLISATGSCAMGREVAGIVAARMGRSLLELGGNNAVIVSDKADLDLARRAVVFAAVGTAGQRCTTLRRLILHESIADSFASELCRAYASIRIGDPADDGVLMGPLIRAHATERMRAALELAKEQGAEILAGGKVLDRPGFFVEPTLVRARPDMPIVREETFAPILYLLTYRDLDEAIAIQNGVEQGLSSAIFTDSVREAERFLSAAGSDCGIANVNIGTSGAEIGGAFGGEKQTGGGREAGSDAWKNYMRRQTCTLHFGTSLPLAQGVDFSLDSAGS